MGNEIQPTDNNFIDHPAPTSLSNTKMTLAEKMEWSKMMSAGDLLSKTYQGKPANVLFALEYAESIGVEPITALMSVSVFNGKPNPDTDLMVALARRAGHKVFTDFDPETMTATCIIHRRDEDTPRPAIHWTRKDAERADLWGKDNWRKYPGQMLKWRAQAEAIRTACVEVLKGATLSAEEARDLDKAEPEAIQATATRKDRKPRGLERVKPQPKPVEPAEEPDDELSPAAITILNTLEGCDLEAARELWRESAHLEDEEKDTVREAIKERIDTLGEDTAEEDQQA